MTCDIELEREARILVQIMLRGKFLIRRLPFDEFGLFERLAGAQKFRKKLSKNLIHFLQKKKLLTKIDAHFILAKNASDWLNQYLVFMDVKKALKLSNKSTPTYKPQTTPKTTIPKVALMPSSYLPISKLYKRYQKSNPDFFDDAKLATAIHLFSLYEKAKLAPNITMDWEKMQSVRQTHHMGKGEQNESDAQLAAKQILFDFFAKISDEYSQILIEVCLLGNGLEAIEKRNQWPLRSAKLVLSLALEVAGQYFGYIGVKKSDNALLQSLFLEA